MEIRKYLKNYNIVSVISNYKTSIKSDEKVINLLNKKKIEQSLKMMSLNKDILDKKFGELSLSEQFKVDLLTKLNKEIILIGNLSTDLKYKDREIIIKMLVKLTTDYNKKVLIIDDDISEIMDICKYYLVLQNKDVIYETDNVYDDELYKYTKMPEIISFVKKINKKGIKLKSYTNIHELIKAIYRSVS